MLVKWTLNYSVYYCYSALLPPTKNTADRQYMIDFSPGYIVLLITTGLIAGVINTMAGGGSNLTIPALMIMGLPADIANATNRVGVFLQSLVAVKGFKNHDKLETSDIGPILLPTLIGGILGAFAASFSPEWILKPLLLSTMVGKRLSHGGSDIIACGFLRRLCTSGCGLYFNRRPGGQFALRPSAHQRP